MLRHIRIVVFAGACLCARAQWLNQPIAGAPRTAEGKVNMTGPVPRVNGKPDLSGIWQVEAEPRGHGHSEDMHVQERFHRRDFGHLGIAVTVEDPKVFTRPVNVSFVEQLLPDTDVFEHICLEDEKDVGCQPGRGAK